MMEGGNGSTVIALVVLVGLKMNLTCLEVTKLILIISELRCSWTSDLMDLVSMMS